MREFLPTWMCIGTVKGGTTSLYQLLREHPQLWIPQTKETHFFSSVNYQKGLEFYFDSFFHDADLSKKIGELTPKYLIHRNVPNRIAQSLGTDLRFFSTVRNPIDRAWSHYCHSYEKFSEVPYRPTEPLGFEEALSAETERLAEPDEYSFTHHMWNAYRLTGRYVRHLKNWYRVFGQDRVHVILFDDLATPNRDWIDKLTDFLEIDRFPSDIQIPHVNSYSRLGMRPETRQRLVLEFRDDIDQLQDHIGRDLSHWLT